MPGGYAGKREAAPGPARRQSLRLPLRAVRHVNRLQNREKYEGHPPDLLRLMFELALSSGGFVYFTPASRR